MKHLEIADQFYNEVDTASAEIEQGRSLTSELAAKLSAAGLFRMLVPESLGGGQVHPWEFFNTLARVSCADGSTGWSLMIGNTTGLLSASLPENWANEIYGSNPDVITVGVTAPIGRAEVVDGGLKISGRWPFASGSGISQWISGGCTHSRDGEVVLNKAGQPELLLAFFKTEEVTIHDTWDTSGLRGTGSHDFEVTDQFVPEGRWVILGNKARIDAPLYRFPTFGLLALGVSAVSIGIAERAMQEFLSLATEKTPRGASRTLATRSLVQREVAMAAASLASAKALTESAINEAWDTAAAGERLTMEHKAKLRLAATNNAWRASEVVDSLYHAAGGTSIYRKSKFQQCFRDVHVTTQHTMVGQPLYEVVGKVMMGIDPKQPL
ncbi:MAG: alkylation response protein AidB-like acyl-CoA dehydrogenase [Limisphaerales bacterium]